MKGVANKASRDKANNEITDIYSLVWSTDSINVCDDKEKIIRVNQVPVTPTRGSYFETFYGRNLQIMVIS